MSWNGGISTLRGLVVIGLSFGATVACGSQPANGGAKAAPTGARAASAAHPSEKKRTLPPRLASAAVDADYYRERAAALSKGGPDEIAHTDFVRLRHGRMYLPENPKLEQLSKELAESVEARDDARVLAATGAILDDDQADMRAHVVRAAALRKAGRVPEADYQKHIAQGLIDSITQQGDGRGFETAFRVFRVKEEYDLLLMMGVRPMSQALVAHGGQQFDVLEAQARDHDVIKVFFEITELFAEEARAFTAG